MITEVTVLIPRERKPEHELRAYCTMVVGNWLRISDIKIIHTSNNRTLIAFPTRQITKPCQTCRKKRWIMDMFCPACGKACADRPEFQAEERRKAFSDVTHPISSAGRGGVEKILLKALSKQEETLQGEGANYPHRPAIYAVSCVGFPATDKLVLTYEGYLEHIQAKT